MKTKITTTIILCMLLTYVGCDDSYLYEPNPNQQTISSFWKTADDAQRATIACYAGLQEEGTFKRWFDIAFEGRADLIYSSTEFGAQVNFTTFNIINYNEDPFQTEMWRDHYRGVFRTNQVITYVPEIPMDEDLKNQLIAEAKFVRALLYFNLVNLWGNVALQLTPSNPNVLPPYATEQEVWGQIIQDLTEAQTFLPDVYANPTTELGRATRGAARALLGKAYMQLKNWGAAKIEFEKVITSPANYALATDYGDNFRHTNENNKESVFEVQFSNEFNGWFWDKDLPTTSEGYRRGTYFAPRFAAGNADLTCRPWFIEKFFEEKTISGDYDPRLYTTFLWNDTTNGKTDVLYYGKSFKTNIEPNKINHVYCRKYLQDQFLEQENEHSPINHRVIRYADVLLMYAEALNELGSTDQAYQYINQVRARVQLRPLEIAHPEIGNDRDKMRSQIMDERILELGGENVRWTDLKRWDMLATQSGIDFLKSHDAEFKNFEVGKNHLLPILTREIDLNPNLKQNDGY
ncbi:MAG: RagB/SusD family nutrient uptake outer membrane protein [Chryseolinea sp.]